MVIKQGIKQGESDPERRVGGREDCCRDEIVNTYNLLKLKLLRLPSNLDSFSFRYKLHVKTQQICVTHQKKRRGTEPLRSGKRRELRLHLNLL